MTLPSIDMFAAHLANTRALESALALTARSCVGAIRQSNALDEISLTRVYGFLMGAYFENRLYRLLYERGAFPPATVAGIMSETTIEDQWTRAIGEAFAKRHSVSLSRVPSGMPATARYRFGALGDLVKDDLAPLITLRNVLAHGQWDTAFKQDRLTYSHDRTTLVRSDTLWQLQIKKNLIDHLVALVHDLAITQIAFERDFDRNWSRLEHAKTRLRNGRPDAWRANLVRSHESARDARAGR